MKEVIVIKYAELNTKKDNKNFFIKTLARNVKEALKDLDYQLNNDYARMFIYYQVKDKELILDRISKIFGIHEYFIAVISESKQEEIFKIGLEYLQDKEFKTFKVKTVRSDKSFPINSMDFSSALGAHILKNIDSKVNLKNPELLLTVEIRKDQTYIYSSSLKGLGGLPVGVSSKALLLLSGGIDSPVAGFLTMKRGVSLEAIYFESLPHTSLEARDKVINLARALSSYGGEIKLHVIPFTKIQETIYKKIDSSYGITIMRRMMFRISQIIAKQIKAEALVTGEAIGQVASQTLSSLAVINDVVKIPIIRPLICLDKLEIIEISKKINTYETSILPYDDCCSLFIPKHPVINPNLKKAESYEALIEYESLIEEAIANQIIISSKTEQISDDFL